MDKKKNKKYSKLALKTGTEAGKKVIRTKLIIFGLILLITIVGIIAMVQIFPFVFIRPASPTAPVLNDIPSHNTNGNIDLSWSASENPCSYRVMMSTDNGATWSQIVRPLPYSTTFFTKTGLVSGNFKFKIIAWVGIAIPSSAVSNIVEVTVSISNLSPPANPSVSINNGDTTTNTRDVVLSLSCNNANGMYIRAYVDGVLRPILVDGRPLFPEPYLVGRYLTLPKASIGAIYIISVNFTNGYGWIEASDTITLVLDSDGNGGAGGDGGNGEPGITTEQIAIIVVVIIASIGVVIFIQRYSKRMKGKGKLKSK